MRPRPVVGEATVPDAVRRLLDKFDYPDRESPVQVLPILPTLGGGGGGGAFTIQLAAADAHEIEKDKADLQAIGTNDHDVLQQAADLIHADSVNAGGTIWLSSGDFIIDPDAFNLGNDIILRGMGDDTRLVTSSTSGDLIVTGTSCVVRDLVLAGTGGANTLVGIDAGSIFRATNLGFNGVNTGIQPGNQSVITGCYAVGSAPIFVSDDAGIQSVLIANNVEVGAVLVGSGTYWLVVGNVFGNAITADGASYLNIVGNTWVSPTVQNAAIIELNNTDGFVIEDNQLRDTGGWDAMTLDTCTEGMVRGNMIGGTDAGITVVGSDYVTIDDNWIGAEDYLGEHGVVLDGSSNCTVRSNLIYGAGMNADNTYDNITITGASDRNLIINNKLAARTQFGATTRYGVNVGGTGECNMVVGNDLGDATDYGTDALVDTASNTQLFWPNDATYGDNFTDCGSGS